MSIVYSDSRLDADVSVAHYLAEQVHNVETPINRAAVAFVVGCAAVLLWCAWPDVCSGLSMCALVALPLRKPSPSLDLAERAARNYPTNPALQQAWINAIHTVRATKRGWLLDKPIQKGTK